MLKIKQDRIKDLEKFGFRNNKVYYQKIYKTYQKDKIALSLDVEVSTREIFYSLEAKYLDFEIESLDLLYDLIKADMVEKVEG